MMGDCNKCVYSTRDGGCRRWTCEGTKTVDDIMEKGITHGVNMCIDSIKNSYSHYDITIYDILHTLTQLKEQKHE